MGVTVQTGELAIEEILASARLAEELGYGGFLPTEESGKDAMLGAAGFAEEVRAIAAAWLARQQQRAVEPGSKEFLEAGDLHGGGDPAPPPRRPRGRGKSWKAASGVHRRAAPPRAITSRFSCTVRERKMR